MWCIRIRGGIIWDFDSHRLHRQKPFLEVLNGIVIIVLKVQALCTSAKGDPVNPHSNWRGASQDLYHEDSQRCTGREFSYSVLGLSSSTWEGKKNKLDSHGFLQELFISGAHLRPTESGTMGMGVSHLDLDMDRKCVIHWWWWMGRRQTTAVVSFLGGRNGFKGKDVQQGCNDRLQAWVEWDCSKNAFWETLVLECTKAQEDPEHVFLSITISLVENLFDECGVMASPTYLLLFTLQSCE